MACDSTTGGGQGRVYVRHRGRTTVAQQRALKNLLPRYLLDLPTPSQVVQVTDDSDEAIAHLIAEAFERSAPLAIEIGFGNGSALLALARSHPDWNCLGIDVYRPGFGALMLACEGDEIANVRIVDAEASAFLDQLPAASVQRIQAFFPDPWPKKRHHKRRLVNATFAARAANCLAPDASLLLATDWADYAEQMLAVLDAEEALHGGVTPRPGDRPVTPFEAKAHAAGRPIADMAYRRVTAASRNLAPSR